MKKNIIIDNNLFRKITHSSDGKNYEKFKRGLSVVEGITTANIDMPAPGLYEFLGFGFPTIRPDNPEEIKSEMSVRLNKGEDYSFLLADLHKEYEMKLLESSQYTCQIAINNFKEELSRMNSVAKSEFQEFLSSRFVKNNRNYVLKDLATELMLTFDWGSKNLSEKMLLYFISMHFNATENEIEVSSRFFLKIWKYLKLRLSYESFGYSNKEVFLKAINDIESLIHIADARDYFDAKALLWLIEGYITMDRKSIIFATQDPFETVLLRIAFIKFSHFSSYCWIKACEDYMPGAIMYGDVLLYDSNANLNYHIKVQEVLSAYDLLKDQILIEDYIAESKIKFCIANG